jgi:hypothetical protein
VTDFNAVNGWRQFHCAGGAARRRRKKTGIAGDSAKACSLLSGVDDHCRYARLLRRFFRRTSASERFGMAGR